MRKFLISLIIFFLLGCAYAREHPYKTLIHASTFGITYFIEQDLKEQEECRNEISNYLAYDLNSFNSGIPFPSISPSCQARLLMATGYSPDTLVQGYYRKNGNYVNSYHRTLPNSSKTDNYSYRGNINPYTGKVGTKE
jgi:hypothetical protein